MILDLFSKLIAGVVCVALAMASLITTAQFGANFAEGSIVQVAATMAAASAVMASILLMRRMRLQLGRKTINAVLAGLGGCVLIALTTAADTTVFSTEIAKSQAEEGQAGQLRQAASDKLRATESELDAFRSAVESTEGQIATIQISLAEQDAAIRDQDTITAAEARDVRCGPRCEEEKSRLASMQETRAQIQASLDVAEARLADQLSRRDAGLADYRAAVAAVEALPEISNRSAFVQSVTSGLGWALLAVLPVEEGDEDLTVAFRVAVFLALLVNILGAVGPALFLVSFDGDTSKRGVWRQTGGLYLLLRRARKERDQAVAIVNDRIAELRAELEAEYAAKAADLDQRARQVAVDSADTFDISDWSPDQLRGFLRDNSGDVQAALRFLPKADKGLVGAAIDDGVDVINRHDVQGAVRRVIQLVRDQKRERRADSSALNRLAEIA